MNTLSELWSLLRDDPIERRVAWVALAVMSVSGMFSTAAVQVCAIVIIAAFVYALVRRPDQLVWSGSLLDLAVPLLVLSRLTSIILSVDPEASVVSLRTELPFYILLYACLWLLRHADLPRMRIIVRLLIVGAVVAAVIGIAVYLTGVHHRARSITSGYYTLGMYLTAIFGLVLGIGPRKEYVGRALVWYAILGTLLVGILFTFNRIHWIIAAILVLIVGLYRDRRLLIGVLGLGLVSLALSEPLRDRIWTLFEPSSSMSDRDVLWREALKLAGDRPITGFGTRSFESIFPEVSEAIDAGVASWHNDMLQIYMESGLVALAAYLALMVTPLIAIARRKSNQGEGRDPLSVGFGLVVLSVFLGGMTGIFFTDPIILPLTYVSIAVVMSRRSKNQTTKLGRVGLDSR